MKLYAGYLLKVSNDSNFEKIWSMKNLSEFGYFERNTAGQYMDFFSTTVANSIDVGSRHSVEEKGYKINAYHCNEGIVGIIVTNAEYPNRVAYNMINELLNVGETKECDVIFQKYKNVNEADKLTKLQNDMAETKVIMHHNIDSVLKRGENLDNLIKKTEELDDASKLFYKKAKKLNSCFCVVM